MRWDGLELARGDCLLANLDYFGIDVHAEKILRWNIFEKKPRYPSPAAPEVENSRLVRQRMTECAALLLDDLIKAKAIFQSASSLRTNKILLDLSVRQPWQFRIIQCGIISTGGKQPIRDVRNPVTRSFRTRKQLQPAFIGKRAVAGVKTHSRIPRGRLTSARHEASQRQKV